MCFSICSLIPLSHQLRAVGDRLVLPYFEIFHQSAVVTSPQVVGSIVESAFTAKSHHALPLRLEMYESVKRAQCGL